MDEKNKNTRQQSHSSNDNTVLHLNGRTQCVRCGNKRHNPDQRCPATGVKCRACGGTNHFYKVCLKVGNATINRSKRVNNIVRPSSLTRSNVSYTSGSDIDNIQNLHGVSKVMISAHVNKHKITMLYDSGAVFSIIGEEMWKQIGSPKLTPTEHLSAYTGVLIETLGKASVNVKAFGSVRKLNVVVVKKNDIPLFGLDWILEFRLPLPPGAKVCTINRPTEKSVSIKDPESLAKSVVSEFPDVFEPSLGTIKNCNVTFYMSSEAQAVVSKPRPVPLALRKAVEDELQRLVVNGVLQPVNTSEEPVVWASPIVIVVNQQELFECVQILKTQ